MVGGSVACRMQLARQGTRVPDGICVLEVHGFVAPKLAVGYLPGFLFYAVVVVFY